MLTTLAAIAIGAGPGERAYHLRVSGPAGSRVALRSAGAPGWIETFCTKSVCALHRVVVTIPPSGTAVVKFDVYRVDESSPHRSRITISGDAVADLSLDVAMP